MDKTIQIDTFSRFTQVSRETITSLKKYEKLLLDANKNISIADGYLMEILRLKRNVILNST